MDRNFYKKVLGVYPEEKNDIVRVLIIPGHSIDRPGAYNKKLNICEHDVVVDIATTMLKNEKDKDISLILTSRNTYNKLPDELNHLNPDIILSLHLNAYDNKTQGTEVLYYHRSNKSKPLAEAIQKELLELGYYNRGAKGIKPHDRGGHLLFKTLAPCVILEPYFLDSITNENVIRNNTLKISEILLNFLYKKFG